MSSANGVKVLEKRRLKIVPKNYFACRRYVFVQPWFAETEFKSERNDKQTTNHRTSVMIPGENSTKSQINFLSPNRAYPKAVFNR